VGSEMCKRARLREDNADARLTEKGRELGLVGDVRWQAFSAKQARLEKLLSFLAQTSVKPGTPVAVRLEAEGGKPVTEPIRLIEHLRRPEARITQLMPLWEEGRSEGADQDAELLRQVEAEVKYAGYIRRQDEEIAKIRRHEAIALPADLNYRKLPGLSRELQQKLAEAQPASLAKAARIPGMTPAALSVLLVQAKKRRAA